VKQQMMTHTIIIVRGKRVWSHETPARHGAIADSSVVVVHGQMPRSLGRLLEDGRGEALFANIATP
jgi:hypothetical protein